MAELLVSLLMTHIGFFRGFNLPILGEVCILIPVEIRNVLQKKLNVNAFIFEFLNILLWTISRKSFIKTRRVLMNFH